VTSKTSSKRFIITSRKDGKTGERESSQAAVPKQEGSTRCGGFAVPYDGARVRWEPAASS
jgi:hypothetical protein